jgi:thymidylate synthase (FAD)
MKIIEPSVEFIAATPNIGQVIELGARNCYKSEDKIGPGTDEKLFNQIVKQYHHDSVVEHGSITLRIITDRAMLAQITRHRHFSFSVESQRYVNYTKDKFGSEITFIKPFEIEEGSHNYYLWGHSMGVAEDNYFAMIENKCKPEVARSVLPNSTKTEIVMTGNVRSWRQFLSLRKAAHAQKDVQHLSSLIHEAIVSNGVPSYLFEDIMGGN